MHQMQSLVSATPKARSGRGRTSALSGLSLTPRRLEMLATRAAVVMVGRLIIDSAVPTVQFILSFPINCVLSREDTTCTAVPIVLAE